MMDALKKTDRSFLIFFMTTGDCVNELQKESSVDDFLRLGKRCEED
jgi:hypothetical protein